MSGLKTERTVTRTEAAEYLREFADKLASGGSERSGDDRTVGAGGDRSMSDDPATGTNTTGETTTGTADTSTRGATEETSHGTETGRTPDQSGDAGAHRYEKVTFLVGNESATVNPPEEVTLNIEVGEDSAMMSSGAETVSFTLHWDKEAVPESDELRIE